LIGLVTDLWSCHDVWKTREVQVANL
jgi:hypothetical protein